MKKELLLVVGFSEFRNTKAPFLMQFCNRTPFIFKVVYPLLSSIKIKVLSEYEECTRGLNIRPFPAILCVSLINTILLFIFTSAGLGLELSCCSLLHVVRGD